jgi:aryl-alcohol dehydrogenase-like predicted oxidoreductase
MRGQRAAELVLGSVQLGLAYGAANRTGKPSHDAAVALVRRAVDAGITTIDTARAYGDSEQRLGAALSAADRIRIVTKLSPLSELAENASSATVERTVDASIETSLAALRRTHLDCLLLHRAQHLTAWNGAVWNRLREWQARGAIAALGVSIQTPAELRTALGFSDVVHVQLPFNLLDWRWREAGVVAALESRTDVTVHVRSVFLQGLLAANDPRLWPAVPSLDPHDITTILHGAVAALGRESCADLCLAYVRGQSWIDGVVIGMETECQLETNLQLCSRPSLTDTECTHIEAIIPRVSEMLLNPALWPAKLEAAQ